MSAAEKLEALRGNLSSRSIFGSPSELLRLTDALPQIVAVVEALEVIRDARDEGGAKLISGWEANAIATTALAALDEQLQDLSSATEPEAPTPR